MGAYSINQIAGWISGTVVHGSGSGLADHLLLDSRKLVFPSTSLFFAIKTPRRNGHQYLPELYSRGVRSFVVSDDVEFAAFPEAVFVRVADTLKALQQLASSHRKQFTVPVIGITGSNGKTIVKEWLNYLLERKLRIVRSPKSYNSQIGVPLSVWQMNADDELAIFEAGISMPGEMAALEKIIQPTIGIITNIGEAHSEGFSSIEHKLIEKLRLFAGSHVLIYCRDHMLIDNYLHQHENSRIVPAILFSWGRSDDATVRVTEISGNDGRSHISIQYNEKEETFSIPFTDQASIENAMHGVATALYLGYSLESITEKLSSLPVIAMRLEMKQGINRCSVINDSYSADWSSLKIALDFLSHQQQHPKRTVILSDIFQSGKKEEELYASIAEAFMHRNINRLIGIGPSISRYSSLFSAAGMETRFYPATEAFIEHFHPAQFRDETILLKGSRAFEFERISHLLEQKVHQTVLEINLSSITHNLRTYQRLLKPSTKLMVMVKAFSYGAGSYEIANLLQFHHVDYLTVAYADEGVDLRKAGISLPVMVMNTEMNAFPSLTTYDLQPEIYSMVILQELDRFLRSEGITEFPVHIKLDTGMHRLGFAPGEMNELCRFLSHTRSFRIQSVFSHLVAGEDPAEDAFTLHQAALFNKCCAIIREELGYDFIKHIANTAAIRRHPDLQMDMVRLGIGLYGIDPAGSDLSLQEVSTLKTTVAQTRMVPAGETVGYNRKGKVERDSVIATIRIGYADGYPRILGNGQGRVLINGHIVPVIGNVCMDMTMVDITGIGEVKEGDDVIVFGPSLSVSELARRAQTIPYEILTGISQRVQRVYFEE